MAARGEVCGTAGSGATPIPASAAATRAGATGRATTSSGTALTRVANPSFIALGVLVRPDGGLVAVGQAWPTIALAGYQPNGELDENFGTDGRTATSVEAISAASTAALQFGKRIVISGVTGNDTETLSDTAFLVARYGLVEGSLPDCCERTPSVNGLG